MVILLPFNKGSLFMMEATSNQITTIFTEFLLFTSKLPCRKERKAKAPPPLGCPINANPHLGSLGPKQRDKDSPPTWHSRIGPTDPSAFFSHRTNASEITWAVCLPLPLPILLYSYPGKF